MNRPPRPTLSGPVGGIVEVLWCPPHHHTYTHLRAALLQGLVGNDLRAVNAATVGLREPPTSGSQKDPPPEVCVSVLGECVCVCLGGGLLKNLLSLLATEEEEEEEVFPSIGGKKRKAGCIICGGGGGCQRGGAL